MNYTKEEIRELAQQYLIEKGRKYSSIESTEKIGYRVNDKILHGKREGEYTDVFIIGYDYTVVNEERGAIIYIDAETGEVLYSINSHGWIEEIEED